MTPKTISFLLGSGFSIPEGLPGVKNLSQRLSKINESEILIHTDQRAMFLNGQEDLNRGSNSDSRVFLQEFLEYYNSEILASGEEFHYECFYDFYVSYLRNQENKLSIETFYQRFNAKYYSGANGQRDCHNRIYDFNRNFNQLLGSLLHRSKYFEDVSLSNYPLYDSFINMLGELVKKFQVKLHTLNHDLFFDWIGQHHGAIWQYYSDGYELAGSPFYGALHHTFEHGNTGKYVTKEYYVKLERFTDKFDTPLSVYKLHGSIFNTIVYPSSATRARLKNNYKINRYFHEVPDGKSYKFEQLWDQVMPDFISGTTEKVKHYSGDPYYSKLFKHFEKNLSESELLIVMVLKIPE